MTTPGLQNELCKSETSSRKIFSTLQFKFLSMHHVVNTVSAGPGITFTEGREEHADTSVLDTEMENNINDQENS